MKEKRFDANRNMESLDLVWVSRANASQRKGRAGRVMPGVSIHLFTKHRFTHHFSSQPVPEIHRVPLEQLLLRIKTLPNFQSRDVNSVIGKQIIGFWWKGFHFFFIPSQYAGTTIGGEYIISY